jgi:hypothetical protein
MKIKEAGIKVNSIIYDGQIVCHSNIILLLTILSLNCIFFTPQLPLRVPKKYLCLARLQTDQLIIPSSYHISSCLDMSSSQR